MAMRVGLVKVLSGSAVAISPDGTKRILHEGDIVFAYEVIRNESGEKLVIEFDGGKRTVLGEHDQIIINTDVLSVVAGQAGVPGQDDDAVTSIQKAILAGSDPTLITEPPAAGLGENHGHSEAEITQRLNQQVTPDSGHDTIGISQAPPGAGALIDAVGTLPAPVTEGNGLPALSINDRTVNESAGTVTFTVSLDNASSSPVTVNYATADGTAMAGSDYTAANGTLIFAPGETSKTITIPILNDTVYEGSETFQINLTAPTNATLGDAQGIGTIEDDDTPRLTVSSPTVAEGGQAVFTVSLSNPSTSPVVFTPTLASGTALLGTDTAPASALQVSTDGGGTWSPVTGTTVTIPAGATSVQLRLATLTDTLNEPSETFSLGVSVVGGGTANATATGTATILDNHVPVATNDFLSTREDTTLIVTPISLLANDVDADGHNLTITSVSGPTHGGVLLNSDGTISFTPATNYSGPASFIYTVSDGHGGTGTATANINVTPVADAPSLNMSLTTMGSASPTQEILFDNTGWNPIKLILNSFVDNPNTSFDERAPFNSIAWQGQTSNSEWTSNFWKINSTAGKLTYNEGGADGSDDAYGMMAYNLANEGYDAATGYTVSADIFGDDASQQNNGAGIVFGYVNDSNYFMARWENPGDTYSPSGSFNSIYPGVANQVTLMQMVNGAPVYLGTFSGFSTPNEFNMRVQVTQTSINVYLNDHTPQYPGTNPAISYIYGSVQNGAVAAPPIKTIGMYVFDNDNGVTFDNVQVTQITGYQYSLNLLAALNDKDGSEALSAVTLSNLPADVTLTGANGSAIAINNGSAIVPVTPEVETSITVSSPTPLTSAQITAMTGAVTATELADGSTASTTAHVSTFVGSHAADTLIGSANNDILIGGRGNDILTGGGGDDIFVIRSLDDKVDIITDYNMNAAGENDKLNIVDVLVGTGVTPANINNYVHIDGATGMLSIDPAGTAHGTNVAALTGITSGADVRLIIDQLGTEAVVHVA